MIRTFLALGIFIGTEEAISFTPLVSLPKIIILLSNNFSSQKQFFPSAGSVLNTLS
jgi:hypothetical protein